MKSVLGMQGPRRLAITDLYDPATGTFLVQYPVALVVGLGVSGIVAVAITGFLGYSDQGLDGVFRQPWALFTWLCALVVTLQVSILRDRRLRRQLSATLGISLISIALVAMTTFFGPSFINEFVLAATNRQVSWTALGANPYVYSVINFGLIAIFWADSLRQWIRRSRGLPPSSGVALGLGSEYDDLDAFPSLTDLIAGDLIAGGILALLLSLIFRADVLSGLLSHQGLSITSCSVSFPFGACVPGGPNGTPTLTFIDLIVALVTLPMGLLVLSLSATLSGLAVGSSAHTQDLEGPAYFASVSTSVSETLVSTLRAAILRRARALSGDIARAFRNVLWPTLIFLAIYGVNQFARDTQAYLHSPRTLEDVLLYGAPMLEWAFLSALSIVFSPALMLFQWRVVENTLRFLGLMGFIFLLTYWIFSFALWGFNVLLKQVAENSVHSPFVPLGFSTLISLLSLLAWGAMLLITRWRNAVAMREEETQAFLREKEQANDFDVLLLGSAQDAAYMRRHLVRRLQRRFILPLCIEEGGVAPPADHVKSAVVCLGKQAMVLANGGAVAEYLGEMADRKIPVAIALLPGYRRGLQQMSRRFPLVDLRGPLVNVVNRLEPIIGKVDLKEYRAYFERKERVRRGLANKGILADTEFGSALLALMGVTETKAIATNGFDVGEAWTGRLPTAGLRLQSAIIFLRANQLAGDYQKLLDERMRDECVLVIDIADVAAPAAIRTMVPVVWVNLAHVQAWLDMNRANLERSVKRLLTQQIKEGLYPYNTQGKGTLFFGRERELKLLASANNHGGIIVGAHHGGKTTLLYKLKDELTRQRRAVIGPLAPTGVGTHQEFFDRVQQDCERLFVGREAEAPAGVNERLTIDNFSPTLRAIAQVIGRVSLLIDEVDSLLEVDETQGMRLTKIMRTVQQEEQADFYLAGHSRLRSALVRQESPLVNFATEITVTGLDEPAALRLVQEPMEQLGYEVTTEQARRIFTGTAGIAWLIQHFCIALLHLGEDRIDDAMIERIERAPSYLQAVWDYYEYGLDVVAFAILMLSALHPGINRRHIMERFADHAVGLTRATLDERLAFLVNFGVLREEPAGCYSVLSGYFGRAIEARDPESLLLDALQQAHQSQKEGAV